MSGKQKQPRKVTYRVDTTKRKRFHAPIFKEVRRVVSYEVVVDDAEVEKFLKKHGRLPRHVYPVEVKEDA